MNHFNVLVKHNAARQLTGPHPVEMTLTAEADASWGEVFRAEYELEILRGSRQVLPDGCVEYRFELNDEKAVYLRQALTMVFFNPPTN